MLALRPEQKIIEKILTTRNGKHVRVTFVIVETAGNIALRVLSVTPIHSTESNSSILHLSGTATISKIAAAFEPFSKIISPYVSLFFYDSQPTRAPNFV